MTVIGPKRIILFGVIAAVAVVIILYPLLVSVPQSKLQMTEIKLVQVKLLNGIDQSTPTELQAVFAVNNPSDVTLTTSRIDYELFADGNSLGSFALTYEDVPLNGRPALFPNQPVNLTSTIQLDRTDDQAILMKIKECGGTMESSRYCTD